MITVTPLKIGPDYSGLIDIGTDDPTITVQTSRGMRAVATLRIRPEEARLLFGKLGDALKLIEANQGLEGE